jgi:hypothetical protein
MCTLWCRVHQVHFVVAYVCLFFVLWSTGYNLGTHACVPHSRSANLLAGLPTLQCIRAVMTVGRVHAC